MAVKKHVRAHEPQKLDDLWHWIQDAEFSAEGVRWDQELRRVVIPITNHAHDLDDPDFPAPTKVGESPLAESFHVPWFRATLTIHEVREMRPSPTELVEPGVLMDFDWTEDRNVIEVHALDATFDAEVDRFDVELTVTDEIDHWRKHVHGSQLRWEGVHGEVDPSPEYE